MLRDAAATDWAPEVVRTALLGQQPFVGDLGSDPWQEETRAALCHPKVYVVNCRGSNGTRVVATNHPLQPYLKMAPQAPRSRTWEANLASCLRSAWHPGTDIPDGSSPLDWVPLRDESGAFQAWLPPGVAWGPAMGGGRC